MTEREKAQKEALQQLITHESGIIKLPMRFGKTKVIMDYLNYLTDLSLDLKVLYVVPTTTLRDIVIPNEIVKWGNKKLLDLYAKDDFGIIRTCYKSLSKIKDKEFDIVILDEVQDMSLNQGVKFFKKNNNVCKRIVPITGTLPDNKEKLSFLKKSLGLDIIYSKSLEEAVHLGVIAPFEFWIVKVPLDTRNNIEIKYKDKRTGEQKSFKTSEKSQYEYFSKQIYDLEDKGEPVPKYLSNKRYSLLNKFQSKHVAMKETLKALLKADPDNRILCFSPNISQAESLGNSYHSKSPKKGDSNMTKFLNEEINHLSLVKKGGVGDTYQNLTCSLISGIDSKSHNLLQKHGRLLIPRKGYKAISFIFINSKSVEVNYLMNATKDIDPSTIKFINYDKLKKSWEEISES